MPTYAHTHTHVCQAPADKAIEADRANGFISAGRKHLHIVPSIMVPKNCVQRHQWKFDESGSLTKSIKWRVSTDDSIEIDGETSRNNGMNPDEWEKPGLPTPRTLAEMVAITKSSCEEMKISATQFELEQIALWAFDLTHAYREVGIQRAEQGRQCVSTSAFKRKLNSTHTRASVPLVSHTTSEPRT